MKFRCILFPLIILDIFLKLNWSPPVVSSIDWRWFLVMGNVKLQQPVASLRRALLMALFIQQLAESTLTCHFLNLFLQTNNAIWRSPKKYNTWFMKQLEALFIIVVISVLFSIVYQANLLPELYLFFQNALWIKLKWAGLSWVATAVSPAVWLRMPSKEPPAELANPHRTAATLGRDLF